MYGDVLQGEEIFLESVSIPTGLTVVGDKIYVADYTSTSAPGLVHAYDIDRGTETTPNPESGNEIGAPIQVGVAPIGIYKPPAGAAQTDLYVPNAIPARCRSSTPIRTRSAATVPVAAFPTEIAFSPDGSLAYVAGTETLSIIDTSSREFVLTTATDGTTDGVPFDHVAASEDFIYLSDQYNAPYTGQTVATQQHADGCLLRGDRRC